MAGELTLPVVLGTLLRVGVVDDAVSGAGHDLLIVSVGHELGAEDVRPMARADGLLDLEGEKMKNGHMFSGPKHTERHRTHPCAPLREGT